MKETFYWHDYETWGIDPRRDRAAQFAGIRTDHELNVIGRPLVVYCKPANDMLPHPEACLVTGITPQQALQDGVNEAEFFSMIYQEMIQSGTCGVGYNSIRFDDEFTRYGFYRNFYDAYSREWQNGNSRWDIIDVVRLTHALRPEGIVWPKTEEGVVSFRLELLTSANGISHEAAHDALSDVYATIAIAKLIKTQQPRLFDYLFQLRNKRKVANLLKLGSWVPVLHVSSMYPVAQGCLAMVVPLAQHPTNANGIIVYDLRYDPTDLVSLEVDEIQRRLFTPRCELPEGMERIPLKTIHINKSPAVVPVNTLTPEAAERWSIDPAIAQRHLEQLKCCEGLAEKIQAVHAAKHFDEIDDPDQALYSGGFFSPRDRRMMDAVIQSEPGQLAGGGWQFEDDRLPEMLFRYRARNWPETLSGDELSHWNHFRLKRLLDPAAGVGIHLSDYRLQLAKLMVDNGLTSEDAAVLSALADWPEQLGLEQK